jgi:hypothetical protein
LPFLADFEQANALVGWQYVPDQWRVVNEGGNTALYGSSGLNNSLVILGQEVPEWSEPANTDLVLRFKFKLLQTNSGGRLMFRYSENGYYVLEMLGGLFRLRRGNSGNINRSSENDFSGASYNQIQQGRWYEVLVWVEGGRTYVYLDQLLVIQVMDTGLPLPAGGILLQTFSTGTNPVAFDDILVQRAEPSSDHFDNVASFPNAWARDPIAGVTMDSRGSNQFVKMAGVARLVPLTSDLEDFVFSCSLRSAEGDFKIRLRDSAQGGLLLDGQAGNLVVAHVDGTGNIVESQRLQNFYSRDFNNIIVELVGERVRIYSRNGTLVMDRLFSNLPRRGSIVFETTQGFDIFYVDDCLIASTKIAATSEAEFAFAILETLNNPARRPYREGLDDFTEDFSDAFGTRLWWESDPGEHIVEPGGQPHSRYYVLSAEGDMGVFRRLRREIDSTGNVFNAGQDRTTFRDSTDIYVKIDVRIPPEAPLDSVAWVGVRSSINSSRTGLDQYQIELIKKESNRLRVRIRPFLQNDKTYIYNEFLPDVQAGDWVELVIITEDDRIAFFANGRFLATLRPVSVLGGTLAIGVDGHSIAHFDDLIIRDTTVNE